MMFTDAAMPEITFHDKRSGMPPGRPVKYLSREILTKAAVVAGSPLPGPCHI